MEGKDEMIADINGITNMKKLFAFRNSRLLLFLLKQVSSGVEQFFQSLGMVLLPKRTLDNYHKENATLVAEQIAQSLVDSFTYRKFDKYSALDLARYHDSILNTTNKVCLPCWDLFDGRQANNKVSGFPMVPGLSRVRSKSCHDSVGACLMTCQTQIVQTQDQTFSQFAYTHRSRSKVLPSF